MDCQRCGRADARMSYFVMENGHTNQVNVCEDCLKQVASERHLFPMFLLPSWILRSFKKEESEEIFNERCGLCGRTFLEFLLEPKEKCPACQEPFFSLLVTLLNIFVRRNSDKEIVKPKEAQKKTFHFPFSRPKKGLADARLSLAFLKERLEALIHDERYEEASKMAGEIKILRNSLQEQDSLHPSVGKN